MSMINKEESLKAKVVTFLKEAKRKGVVMDLNSILSTLSQMIQSIKVTLFLRRDPISFEPL